MFYICFLKFISFLYIVSFIRFLEIFSIFHAVLFSIIYCICNFLYLQSCIYYEYIFFNRKKLLIKSIILHFLSFEYFYKPSYSLVSMFLCFSKSRAHSKLVYQRWPTSGWWPLFPFTFSSFICQPAPPSTQLTQERRVN